MPYRRTQEETEVTQEQTEDWSGPVFQTEWQEVLNRRVSRDGVMDEFVWHGYFLASVDGFITKVWMCKHEATFSAH